MAAHWIAPPFAAMGKLPSDCAALGPEAELQTGTFRIGAWKPIRRLFRLLSWSKIGPTKRQLMHRLLGELAAPGRSACGPCLSGACPTALGRLQYAAGA